MFLNTKSWIKQNIKKHGSLITTKKKMQYNLHRQYGKHKDELEFIK